MKLLIITQKVDMHDSILGFFHTWLRYFAYEIDMVTVICLEQGIYDVPKNVHVLSLGKEKGVSRLTYISNFYRYIWSERNNYDAVFVHMNPEYVLLGGLFWKLWHKKITLWYTHRHVDTKLRIAEKLSDRIFTSAKESFMLASTKVRIVGHGIDVQYFKKPDTYAHAQKGESLHLYTILSVGRITPIKNLDILIQAAALLRDKHVQFRILIVGAPARGGDEAYRATLQQMVIDSHLEDVVTFVGSVPNTAIREYYWRSDLSINLSPTGGVDKVVLESMAAGLPVLASNTAFASYFGIHARELLCEERNAIYLANRIMELCQSGMLHTLGRDLQHTATSFDSALLISKLVHDIAELL